MTGVSRKSESRELSTNNRRKILYHSLSDFLQSGDATWQRDTSERKSASVCLTDDEIGTPTLTLQCPPDHMVKLNHLFYGFASDANKCEYTTEDCVMPVPGKNEYGCVGQSRCDIALPLDGQPQHLTQCERRSNYMQAEYSCVNGKLAFDSIVRNISTMEVFKQHYN